jgi:uncharacterized protein YjbI with pentapeptide repeats
MAIPDHIARLMDRVDSWNTWRAEHPEVTPDLSGADLFREDLGWANLRGANLSGQANLLGTDLGGADLQSAQLDSVVLCGSNLRNADLRRANLFGADLQGADLRQANLRFTNLLDADLRNADLTGSLVFGTSAWNLKLEGTKQRDLVITEFNQPPITVDNIEVAQFIHLLRHNEKIHQFIDTITSKAVLILGRFTAERKAVLDAIREELRKSDYLPIVFDFEKPRSLDTDETITLLARMAKFIIVDISDAKSVLQELRAIIPDLPSVPVQPIILATQEEPGMFDFYRHRPSFLSVHRYATQEQLLVDLGDKVIRPAELKVLELRG